MRRVLALAAALLVAACVALEPPRTLAERIAYAESTAQAALSTLHQLTCMQFAAGQCVEPGKPLLPSQALPVAERIGRARAALRTAAGLGAGGVGDCMGKPETAEACLRAVNAVLAEIERYLRARTPAPAVRSPS